MKNFIVRIELHRAHESDYARLHEAMESEGFHRWIEAKGCRYRLPTAEYNFMSELMQLKEVRDLATAVATAVKSVPPPWVLVTESAGRAWSGLETL